MKLEKKREGNPTMKKVTFLELRKKKKKKKEKKKKEKKTYWYIHRPFNISGERSRRDIKKKIEIKNKTDISLNIFFELFDIFFSCKLLIEHFVLTIAFSQYMYFWKKKKKKK